MATPIKSAPLRASKAPNMPIAPVVYDQQYQDQFSNALRLYYSQIDNLTQAVVNPINGITASRPLSTSQVPLPIGTIYFDTTLGIPVWWKGTVWVNASGTVV